MKSEIRDKAIPARAELAKLPAGVLREVSVASAAVSTLADEIETTHGGES